MSKTRDAGILESNSELLVFAPAYPTRKGTVLGQLWFLPTSKTILLVLSCSYTKNAEKLCGPGRGERDLKHLLTTAF